MKVWTATDRAMLASSSTRDGQTNWINALVVFYLSVRREYTALCAPFGATASTSTKNFVIEETDDG